MAKPGGKNPGGKPKASAARVGSGAGNLPKGGKKLQGAGTQALLVPTRPAETGAADVVQQRKAQATQGVMLSKQLRKNKSTGISAR